MPLKLIEPRAGKSPYWRVRGTHLGIYVDRSTKATDRATSAKFLKLWKEEIERGSFVRPGEPTFLDAAVNYMAATGEERFIKPILERLGTTYLSQIDQQKIDECAIALYPTATPATRNRQVYTVISAILKHAGIETKFKRPKGSRGKTRVDWLTKEQAFRLLTCAYAKDYEFGVFLTTLLYTGMRLSEALSLITDRVNLSEQSAYLPVTKNSEPRNVYLPPIVVSALANHPRGLDRQGQRVFRFRKCGRLYTWLAEVKAATGVDVDFVSFHTFRHTWATWMRRYGGLDVHGLVATKAWSNHASASRYTHVVVSEESKKADRLPVFKLKRVSNKR